MPIPSRLLVRPLRSAWFAAALLGAMVLPAYASRPAHGHAAPHPKQLDQTQRIVHVLNRMAFGPRPGDVVAVGKMGLGRWIEAQLHPETIDDAAVDARIARLPSLQKPVGDLMAEYRGDLMAQRLIQQQRRAAARQAAAPAPQAASQTATAAVSSPPPMAMAAAPAPPVQPRRPTESIETLGELDNARLIRAVESSRQLQEVLVDFWMNHFNVDARKGPVRSFIVADERDTIRPRVLGRFRDLLEATAKSPAMLFYLDNASSTREFPAPPGRPGRKRGGVNENYARELMELHTLSVNGGYTQRDVQEVARCFTGWSIDPQTGDFRFYPFRHDPGEKVVLGHTIPAGGGVQDGETVLDILASSPATARFISRKLCMRLVSDTPPLSLVDRAAHVFTTTGGDLRAVVRTIVTSREFFSPEAYRAKVKSPFEYAVSCVRALGGTVDPPDLDNPRGRLLTLADGGSSMSRGGAARYGRRAQVTLARAVASMGEPLYAHEAPTGYPEDSREWVSSGALLARLNFAMALAGNRVAGVQVPEVALPASAGTQQVAALGRALTGAGLSPATCQAIEKNAAGSADPAALAALVLASPDFQRR